MDSRSLEGLAALHRRCLPESLVARAGASYVRAFYRYVDASASEAVVLRHDTAGVVIGAAVCSVRPATLMRRLAFRTPLMAAVLRHLPRFLPLARGVLAGWRARPHTATRGPSRPQLLLVFVDETCRGSGHGSALVREIERFLQERGVEMYEVSTEAVPHNPAVAFYERLGFTREGGADWLGRHFHVFVKSLAPAAETRSYST